MNNDSASDSSLKRLVFLVLALLFLALGLIGIILPGLPTTPFILLAAWAAAKSSPRLLAWLQQHPLFGDMIRNWQAGGTVSRQAKWSATIVMSLCGIILILVTDNLRLTAFGILSMTVVLVWLWRRPEPANQNPQNTAH